MLEAIPRYTLPPCMQTQYLGTVVYGDYTRSTEGTGVGTIIGRWARSESSLPFFLSPAEDVEFRLKVRFIKVDDPWTGYVLQRPRLHRPRERDEAYLAYMEVKEELEPLRRLRASVMSMTSPEPVPNPVQVAESLFPLLVQPPSQQPEGVFERLLEDSVPEAIVKTAFEMEYRREHAALLADSLLQRFGARAWSALEQISCSKDDRCLVFLDTIISCPGVDAEKRLAALSRLAKHPNPDVRWELLSRASLLPREEALGVLRSMEEDTDEDIRAAVRRERRHLD